MTFYSCPWGRVGIRSGVKMWYIMTSECGWWCRYVATAPLPGVLYYGLMGEPFSPYRVCMTM